MERIRVVGGGVVATEAIVCDRVDPVDLLPKRPGRTRVAILAQPSVANRAQEITTSLSQLGLEAHVRVLPDREEAKTLDVAADAYIWMNSIGMTRADTVVAIGGGAATDLGGFVGATYLRGIETVLVPTTLLGSVDAAIGGKNGVNVGGKNLAGTFRHPARVVIEMETLRSLPSELIVEGAAEILKAGLIADTEIVELYRRDGINAPLDELVVKAISVKAEVVGEDFQETGRRAILNYGHTVGHAIELLGAIPHGHAVAIGMVAAGYAAETVTGFRHADAQKELIGSLGLPVESPPLNPAAVLAAMDLDKKRDATGLRMVLLEDVGRPTVVPVAPTTVTAALRAVGLG